MKNTLPLARFENIVVQEIKDEVLICDTKSNQVFCLNQTAGEVWKLCDGKTETNEIAEILGKKLKANFSEELVLFSLVELSNYDLLKNSYFTNDFFAKRSRREVIKKIGLSSMLTLPLISSVVMPKAIQAASGNACTSDNDCNDSSCCHLADQVCISLNIRTGCACVDCFDCLSGSGCCFNGICVENASNCNTSATCGATLACPSGFQCCNSGNAANTSTCSACGC